MFPTAMLASATQRRILRTLAEKNKRYTIAELAELCHRSEPAVSRALAHTHRYPFLEKDHVRGSKRLTFRLDPASPYTAAIRAFFAAERDRERQSGTIPLEVWNLLEEVTAQFESAGPEVIELFLYGSYATGEYYAGSDIDLIIAHVSGVDIDDVIEQVRGRIDEDRLQILPVSLDASSDPPVAEEVLDRIYQRSPIESGDMIIPLIGEVAI